MKYVVVLLTLVVLTSAQQSLRCYTPSRWTGSFREINYDDRSMRFANISYDATQEAIAITEIEREPGDTRRYERVLEVFLYREKRSYRVDLTTGSCSVSDLEYFQRFGVREDDTYVGTDYIGSAEFGTAGVKVNEYIRRDDGDYSGSWSPIGFTECIPILESFIRGSAGRPPAQQPMNTHIQFLNIREITNFPPETFMKPRQCP